MAIKADDLIKLRTEGMAYALKIATTEGVEELAKQLKMRGALRITPIVKEEELNVTIDRLSEKIYNNMLTMVYAVMHDDWGFGNVRLQRFKKSFDKKVYLVGEQDPQGKHYARFEDFAEEANRLHDLGINIDSILQTQLDNDYNNRRYVAIDQAVAFLKKKGFTEAADALQRDTDEPERKHLNKKQRMEAQSRRESDRRNKYYMDANEEENIEYWFNVFGLALSNLKGISAEELIEIWTEADEINGGIADGATTLSETKNKLLDYCGINCNFTKGGC